MSTRRRGSLALGLSLCALAGFVALAPTMTVLLGWLARTWPVFLMLWGGARLAGYALARRPSSPVGGALLLAIGGLLLAFTIHSAAGPFEFYGRNWPVLLVTFALVELLRHYSHRPDLGERPPIFTPGKLAIIALITTTGMLADRVASVDPNILARLRMPAFLSALRDSFWGEEFAFDAIAESASLPQNGVVSVVNKFGSIVVEGTDGDLVEISLVRKVRATERVAAEAVAGRVHLNVKVEGSTLTVGTNRDEVGGKITTDLTIRVPKRAGLRLSQAHGRIDIANIETSNRILVDAAHTAVAVVNSKADIGVEGSHASVSMAQVVGRLSVAARHTDVDLADLSMSSIDLSKLSNAEVRIARVRGEVFEGNCEIVVNAEHTDVSLDEITGNARVRTRHGHVRASKISGFLDIEADHTEVWASEVGSAKIQTSHDDVRVSHVRGPLDVAANHSEVRVLDFGDRCSVKTSHEDVRVETDRSSLSSVSVDNEHGDVVVKLPDNVPYAFSTTVSHGEVRMDEVFERAAPLDGSARPITIKTSYNDIVIRASEHRSDDSTED